MPVLNESKMCETFLNSDSALNQVFQRISPKIKNAPLKGEELLSAVDSLLEDSDFKFDVPVTEKAKDIEKAMKLKAEGNTHFKENRFREARNAYTASLMYCPFNEANPSDNKESAALDSGFFYWACVADIDLAFKYGYPKNLQFKIYKRKGHALLRLKQYIDAQEALKNCLNMIGKSDMSTKLRDQTRVKVRKHMNVFTVVKKLYNQPLDNRPLKKLKEDDATDCSIPNVSNKLELKSNDKGSKRETLMVKNGRVVQTEDVILHEEAYAAVLHDGPQRDQICPTSFEHMPGPQPCPFGSQEMFSTEEARDQAVQSWHKYEWRIHSALSQLGLSSVSRLALRILTTAGPKEVDEQQAEGVFAKVMALCDEEALKKCSKDEAKMLLFMAAVLSKLLNVAEFKSSSRAKLITAMVRALWAAWKHATPLTVPKPLSGSDYKSDLIKLEQFPTSELGIGIFPTYANVYQLSQVSESGISDAFTFCQSKYLVVQSLRNLEGGAPVTLKSAPREEVINEMITFKCSNESCTLGFPLKENTNEKVIRCPLEECNKETNIWLKLKRIQELKELHKKARSSFETGTLAKAKQNFSYLISEWDKIIYRPYKEISVLEQQLRMAIRLEQVETDNEWLNTH